MKRKIKTSNLVLVIVMVLSMSIITACGEEVPENADQNDEAITQAINELTPPTTSTNDDPNRRTMTVNRAEQPPYDNTAGSGAVSVSEPPVLNLPSDDIEPVEEVPDKKEGTYTGNGTPLVFDISDCTCIAFGEFDKAMSDAIFAAINVYRANGGLEPLEKNQSLGFCADCRAKEASYSFTHYRMNATFWYTVAPAYYKAELMATDYATAQQTVDAWMQTATGRQYLLGSDLMSIGISTFRTDGRNYIVCSLGD